MCKKTSALTMLFFTLTCVSAQAQDRISIEAFGEKGTAVPDVSRAMLSECFFTQNMSESLLGGDNYKASFEIPNQIAISGMKMGAAVENFTRRTQASKVNLTLHLENRAGRPNDVVVSAMADAGAVRNFLVRIEPGQTLALDAAALANFDRLHFLSLQEFSAKVDSRLHRAAASSVELEVRHALTKSFSSCDSASAYCSECDQDIEICLDGGTCVDAVAKRRFDHTTGSHTWYSVDIYYPTASTKFHSYTSAGQASGEPVCRSTYIRTKRTDNSGPTHKWTGLDKTLFGGDQSTAICYTNCTGTFTVNQL